MKVFLNLNIWIYTPYSVQRELLMALLNFCESEAGLAQSHISLPRILDLVQQFYWVRSSRKVSGTKRLFHPVTKQVIGSRPSLEEVGKLRILLLSTAEMVVRLEFCKYLWAITYEARRTNSRCPTEQCFVPEHVGIIYLCQM